MLSINKMGIGKTMNIRKLTVGGKLIGNTLLTQTVRQTLPFSTKTSKMWKNKISTFINSQEYSPIFAS
jgi:hypothetical protein